MTIYRCRFVLPYISEWHEVTAESPEDATNDFHEARDDRSNSYRFVVRPTENSRYVVSFTKVEVEGHDSYISRVFHYAIWRRGGVRPKNEPTLADIANKLGWEYDPKLLLSEDPEEWTGVETMEEARDRDARRTARKYTYA